MLYCELTTQKWPHMNNSSGLCNAMLSCARIVTLSHPHGKNNNKNNVRPQRKPRPTPYRVQINNTLVLRHIPKVQLVQGVFEARAVFAPSKTKGSRDLERSSSEHGSIWQELARPSTATDESKHVLRRVGVFEGVLDVGYVFEYGAILLQQRPVGRVHSIEMSGHHSASIYTATRAPFPACPL